MRRRFKEDVSDDQEFLDAVKVVESRGYRVMEFRKACASREDIMANMSTSPTDLYALSEKIYGTGYTDQQKKRLRSMLKNMETEGYVCRGPDRFMGRCWISTWRLT